MASEKEIKDFMEKKKRMVDKEEAKEERAKAKAKKMEENKKKREDKKGNQLCRRHNGAHLYKDCPANPNHRSGRGRGGFNMNFGRGFPIGQPSGRGFQSQGFQGRGFQLRNFQGRGFQGRGFQGRGRGQPQEQYFH